MNNWSAPISVPRSLFLDGHAECRECRAHLRPSPTMRAIVRTGTATSGTAWCSVCCTTTAYELDPHLAA